MKLVVFGSTGGTGRQVVAQALKQGHDVTAFARTPERLGLEHEKLRLIQGNVLEPAVVEDAIQGQDAVICTLGMPLTNKDQLRAHGTANIVHGMEKAGVKKIICLSSLGVGDSYDMLPFHYRYFIIPLILRHVIADHGVQENHINNSRLDWTIVRPANLTQGERTNSYRHGTAPPDKPLKLKVSREDVADFMLRQLSDDTYLHKAPYISE